MAELSYSKLEENYQGFSTPQFTVKVGGAEIKTDEFPILDLSVTMSAGFDMGSCDFTVAVVFDLENGKFAQDVYDKFKPGKVVDVSMGYKKPLTGLFKGYINAISFDFNGQSGPVVTVQCLDAKGALVNNKAWKNYGKLDIKDIVAKILNEKCSNFATISGVESDFDKDEQGAYDESPEIKDIVDDYNYVISFAKKTNNSFCVIYDTLYFCENLAEKAKTQLELTWGKNLLSFSTEINLSGQIGSVEVFGMDPVTHETFSAKADTVPGAGESGADIASVAKNKTIVVIDHSVTNQSQATELAQHTLEAYASQLVKCKGATIGLPEIMAGDKIEIKGMGSGVDGVYYLTHVTHKINGQGYITTFDASSSKVQKSS